MASGHSYRTHRRPAQRRRSFGDLIDKRKNFARQLIKKFMELEEI